MTTEVSNMSLAARVAQFGTVLEHCEITGMHGKRFNLESGLSSIMRVLSQARESRASVFVIGNGGSASIASHAVNDFVNVAMLRAFTLHDSALLTCMANDYGFENAYARMLGKMAKPGDVLIGISSSGRSKNIRNAAAQVADIGGTVITLSGFDAANPLRTLGDINVWLDSSDYGMVEVGHQFVMHNLSDRFGAE